MSGKYALKEAVANCNGEIALILGGAAYTVPVHTGDTMETIVKNLSRAMLTGDAIEASEHARSMAVNYRVAELEANEMAAMAAHGAPKGSGQ